MKVNSLIQEKLEPDFTLENEVGRNWKEIVNKLYRFDRLLKEVEILKTITQEEVCEWLKTHTLKKLAMYRKLSVKVQCSSCEKSTILPITIP